MMVVVGVSEEMKGSSSDDDKHAFKRRGRHVVELCLTCHSSDPAYATLAV